MHACMHSTSGSNHVEAGQTAGYGGYQLVGQSVDPPQAAKIPNPKPVQGEVGLAWSARVIQLSYSCHTAVIHPVGTKFSTLFFFLRANACTKYRGFTGQTQFYSQVPVPYRYYRCIPLLGPASVTKSCRPKFGDMTKKMVVNQKKWLSY